MIVVFPEKIKTTVFMTTKRTTVFMTTKRTRIPLGIELVPDHAALNHPDETWCTDGLASILGTGLMDRSLVTMHQRHQSQQSIKPRQKFDDLRTQTSINQSARERR